MVANYNIRLSHTLVFPVSINSAQCFDGSVAIMNIYQMTNNESSNKHFTKRAKFLVQYLKSRNAQQPILDLGKASPMTYKLEDHFGWIDNSEGDLDVRGVVVPQKHYNTVLYIHTIEHQFNPLTTLLKIKDHINARSRVFIALPRRPYFLQANRSYHYHEISDYGFRNLCERAGFKIVDVTIHRWKMQFVGLWGIRPLLRFFLDKEVIYELKLKS